MFLVVGLGNPGKKFQKSRHNIGFWVLNEFRKTHNFPEFKLSAKFNSSISVDSLVDKKVFLAKPQTFMNLSGKAVKTLAKTFNLNPNNLIVIHDDIDLPLDKIRIVKNRGAAGHKGIESIMKELKTKNFIRFRIGIQPKSGKPRSTEKHVLQKFSKAEERLIKEIIKKTCLAIKMTLKESLEKVMEKYNR